MQISNPYLEITTLGSFQNQPKADVMHFVLKIFSRAYIDFGNLKKTKKELIRYFEDEIAEANTMSKMKNILFEFTHVFISHIYAYAKDKHHNAFTLDNDLTCQVNVDFIKLNAFDWFNDAHKRVYGNKIPHLDRHIKKQRSRLQKMKLASYYKIAPLI